MQRYTKTIYRFILCMAGLTWYVTLAAQNKLTPKDQPIAVTTITRENLEDMPSIPSTVAFLEQIQIGNFRENLSFNDKRVLLGRESITLPEGNKGTLLLLNGQTVPSLTRIGATKAIDLNAIPISAIENVEIIKDGASSIYGSDAISGVTNFIIRSQSNMEGITNTFQYNWQNYVADIFTTNTSSGSWDDNTYGNGKVSFSINPFDIYMLQTMDYYDEFGNRREHVSRKFTKEGLMYEVRDYFSCDGLQVHKQGNYTEPYGYTFPLFDVPYASGNAVTGYRDLASGADFMPYRLPFDLNTGSVNPEAGKGIWQSYALRLPEQCKEKDEDNNTNATINSPERQIMLFGGLSYLMEDTDGGDPFCMMGPGINATYKITPSLGVGIDAAYYTGSQHMWDYSRINLMAGAEYFIPFGSRQQFNVSPFVYAGLSSLKQKYMDYKDTYNNFSGLAGVNVSYWLSDRFGIKGSGAVNPVFAENRTPLNGRLDLGIRYSF